MEKSILKEATLKNSGVWTTTFIWYSLGGCTQIVIKQKYEKMRSKNYIRIEEFNADEFDNAYNRFHQLIKEWL